jgi:hypothetical protein
LAILKEGNTRFRMLPLGLMLAVTVRAQAERLPIKIYTNEDGLANNRIVRIKARGFRLNRGSRFIIWRRARRMKFIDCVKIARGAYGRIEQRCKSD